jgi:hypothetical protein
MENIWRHVLEYGDQYDVDPVLFGILYLAHHPLFWGTMAWIVKRVRARRPVRGHVAMAVFFWLMPYLYVLAFGRNLPVWVYGVVAAVVAVGGTHVVQVVRARLKAPAA